MPRRRGGGGGARRRSGGGLFGGSAPAKASQAPPPAVPQRSTGGGFLGTMMQGFALGTGSAVAHEAIHGAVRSFSGGSEGEHAQQHQQVAASRAGGRGLWSPAEGLFGLYAGQRGRDDHAASTTST